MSRQKVFALIVLAVVFGCGVAVGLHLGEANPGLAGAAASRSDASGTSSPADAGGDLKGNTLLSARIRELEKQLAEQKQKDQTSVADRMAFFKKYHNDLRLQPLIGNRSLSPEMAEVLGLSKEEEETVEQQLKATDDALTKMNSANEFLAKHDANGITIETPADPRGKEIRNELENSLTASMGEDRTNFFVSFLGDESSASPFGGFAQSKKDIEITWANQNGKLLYTIKNQFFDKDNGNSASWYTTPNLPTQYQKYFSSDSDKTP